MMDIYPRFNFIKILNYFFDEAFLFFHSNKLLLVYKLCCFKVFINEIYEEVKRLLNN